VLPAGSVATSRYVALREEGRVCSLALFGNFTYAELHPLEERGLLAEIAQKGKPAALTATKRWGWRGRALCKRS